MSALTDSVAEHQPAGDPDPCDRLEQEESTTKALRLLGRLPENQQEVIRLKFQHGLSYKQISAITNLSVSNVGFLIHVALKTLRRLRELRIPVSKIRDAVASLKTRLEDIDRPLAQLRMTPSEKSDQEIAVQMSERDRIGKGDHEKEEPFYAGQGRILEMIVTRAPLAGRYP